MLQTDCNIHILQNTYHLKLINMIRKNFNDNLLAVDAQNTNAK